MAGVYRVLCGRINGQREFFEELLSQSLWITIQGLSLGFSLNLKEDLSHQHSPERLNRKL